MTDFGLARITDETALSRSGDFVGTPHYMSPEQAASRRMGEIDHRSDVFSLGTLMYEMLALRRPFDGDTQHQVTEQILTRDPPELARIRSRIPRELSVICGQALEKQRERRYASMEEFAADLRRFLNRRPILARPPSRARKLWLWSVRNPAKSLTGGVSAVALLVIALLLANFLRAVRQVDVETSLRERLSRFGEYQLLISEADDFWPVDPEQIPRMERWIQEAEKLIAELQSHRDELELLSSRARGSVVLPGRAERRVLTGESEQRATRGELESRRRALAQRRDGIPAALPQVDNWSAELLDPYWLMRKGRARFVPTRSHFGREAEGYVLASEGLRLAEQHGDEKNAGHLRESLAWALFALGRDEEALAMHALGVPEEHVATKDLDLAAWVEEARSPEGLRRAEEEVRRLEGELEALSGGVSQHRRWEFSEDEREIRWRHLQLTLLINGLEAMQDPETGLLGDGISPEHGWGMGRRLKEAKRLRDAFGPGGD